MKRDYKILWAENGARHDLAELAAPVLMDGRYDLIIAEDASSCIDEIQKSEFDVVIVDIRLPPGNNPDWIRLYQGSNGGERFLARLGLSLLYTLVGHPDAKIKLGNKRPEWLTPRLIGVLTVESKSEIDEDLKKLGVTVHEHKRAEISDDILIKLIQKIQAQANNIVSV